MHTESDKALSDQGLQLGTFIASAALGALVMYLLDPERGAGRRAAAAGRLRTVGRETSQSLASTVQDLAHRAGAADVFHASEADTHEPSASASRRVAEPGTRGGSMMPQSLGSIFSKPLTGIAAVAQGLRERSWDPKVRNAAMWGGGALGLFSLVTRRTPLSVAAGLAGAAMAAGSAAGRPLEAAATGSVDIEKTLRIDAPPEQVYDMWANYDNFPRFMANVVDVRDLGANLSHWTVKGPASASIEFDSILTEQARPHRLAWRTVPGGDLEHRGEVWLTPAGDGTRVTVRMRYTPPAGLAGGAAATMLRKNPARQLDEDLQRLKRLLERGTLPHAAAQGSSADSKFLH